MTMRDHKCSPEDFDTKEQPRFPLLAWGDVWHEGWDIPSCWAIDAAKMPYADYGAHGRNLKRTTFDELIRHIECNGGDASEVRGIVGRKQAVPQWMRTAIQMGWTPPANHSWDDYEAPPGAKP